MMHHLDYAMNMGRQADLRKDTDYETRFGALVGLASSGRRSGSMERVKLFDTISPSSYLICRE